MTTCSVLLDGRMFIVDLPMEVCFHKLLSINVSLFVSLHFSDPRVQPQKALDIPFCHGLPLSESTFLLTSKKANQV